MTHVEDTIAISDHDALEVAVTDARANLADLVDRVRQCGQRIVLTKHKHPIAILASMPDLATLQANDAKAHAALSWPAAEVGSVGAGDFVPAEEDHADTTARDDLLDLKRKVQGVMAEIEEKIDAYDRMTPAQGPAVSPQVA